MKWILLYLFIGLNSMWALKRPIWEYCVEAQKPTDHCPPGVLFYLIAVITVLIWPIAIYCKTRDTIG